MESFILLVSAVVGACIGSFATMLVWRLMHDEPGILTGRSRCPQCKTTLGVPDLVPVLSWLCTGGKCRHCGNKISVYYPITELIFVIVFVIMTSVFYGTPMYWWVMGVIVFALILGVYDGKFQLVDRRISWPAIVLALVWMLFRDGEILDFVYGGLIGGGFYALQWALSRGRWVGAGDIELGIFMGFVLGVDLIIGGLFFAYVIGTLVALPLLITKQVGRKGKLPMGVFLMAAMILFLPWGTDLIDWYLNLLTFTLS